MGKRVLSWIIMIASAVIMILLIIIYIKKPATDKNARRIRRTVFFVMFAVFSFFAFVLFGEHGGMSMIKSMIENPELDRSDTQDPVLKNDENGIIRIVVSGKKISVNGKEIDGIEDLRENLSGFGKAEKIELVDDYAVSSVMHDVMDVLEVENLEYIQASGQQ